MSAPAAEFPGKSEHIEKEKEGGVFFGGMGVQINKFVEKGRGAGKRGRREEQGVVQEEKKGRVSGSKMLMPGCLLAADRRRMWAGFWVAIKSL